MILKKLYIHNYKSFYDTTIELDKFNIVVGENNSGKSNLVDVLEFINIAMTQDIERAVSDRGGYEKIKNYKTNENKVIIRATFTQKTNRSAFILLGKVDYQAVLQGDGEFTISFSFGKDYTYLSVCVNMDFIGTKDMKFIKNYLDKKSLDSLRLDFNKIQCIVSNRYSIKSDTIQRVHFLSNGSKYFIEEHIHGILQYIGFISDNEFNIKREEYSNSHHVISSYYFDAQSIRNKSHQDEIVTLKKDGSNLGKNLFRMVKNMPEFETISNSLIGTVNEIDSLAVYEVAGSYIIAFKEDKKEININQVSDGTINLIATMTALHQPVDNSFMLIFEEPERHLHLKAVNYMIDMFREDRKQILITTHSTEILKYANLKEVIFIYRNDEGDTQSIRADAIPHLEDKMKNLSYERDLTLDELIADGIVGNFI